VDLAVLLLARVRRVSWRGVRNEYIRSDASLTEKDYNLKNECDTYAKSFHRIKWHFTKALQYQKKLGELQNAFESAKQLLQEHLDNLKKQNNVSR